MHVTDLNDQEKILLAAVAEMSGNPNDPHPVKTRDLAEAMFHAQKYVPEHLRHKRCSNAWVGQLMRHLRDLGLATFLGNTHWKITADGLAVARGDTVDH